MRNAFTLIELIITMVILSIVSYIASGVIAKTYISYNRVNTLHKANLKVEIAINSIANRLSYAISETIVKRKSFTNNAIESISSAPSDYSVLEWVGYDIDGFEANNIKSGSLTSQPSSKPAWSGYCNIKASSKTSIKTPGSDLAFAQNIIKRLSNGRADFSNSKVALFFPGNYSFRDIGYSNTLGGITGLALVNSASYVNCTLNLTTPISRVTEHYKLAWSAYAVGTKNCTTNGCDLYLKYNFAPWTGRYYNASTTPEAILATNVTVFKTYATENRVHIKLCVKENIGVNKTTSICKEKVVFKWQI